MSPFVKIIRYPTMENNNPQTIILTRHGWQGDRLKLAPWTWPPELETVWQKLRNVVEINLEIQFREIYLICRTLEIQSTSLDFQLALVGGSVWGNYGAMNVIYGVALVPKTFKLSLHRLNNPMKHFHKSAIQTQAIFIKIKVIQNYQKNIILKYVFQVA